MYKVPYWFGTGALEEINIGMICLIQNQTYLHIAHKVSLCAEGPFRSDDLNDACETIPFGSIGSDATLGTSGGRCSR